MMIECLVSKDLPITVGCVAHVFPTEMELAPEPNPDQRLQRKSGLTRTDVVTQINVDNFITAKGFEYKIVGNI